MPKFKKFKFDPILDEFKSIPRAMLNCLKYYLSTEGAQKLQNIRKFIQTRKIQKIFLIGHSYNYYAAHVPFYYINQSDKDCKIYELDEFVNFYNPSNVSLNEHSIFVFISHSGKSLQIQQAVNKLLEHHIDPDLIWSITNYPDSFLANNSYFSLPTYSGEEMVNGSKSYYTAILILFFIARAFLELDILPQKIEEQIKELIFEMKFFAQDWEFHVKSLTDFFGIDFEYLYFISKGASLATAHQAAVNCKSYSNTFGEGTSIGLFLHGPYQIVQHNPESFRCCVIIGDESSLEDTVRLNNIVSNKLGSGKVMLINNSRQLSSLARGNKNVWVFEHTVTNTYLAPIMEFLVIQYLILDLALRRGVVEKS